MLALSCALSLLLEFSIQIARLHDSRKAKRSALEDVPDDQAAPIGTAEPIEPPTAVSSGTSQSPPTLRSPVQVDDDAT